MSLTLQPRHTKVIEYLTERSPKRFILDELAAKLNLSMAVLRNEAPKLVAEGHICRKAVGRTYEYYVGKTESRYKVTTKKAPPVEKQEMLTALAKIAESDYEPKLYDLAWNQPKAIITLAWYALTGSNPPESCRKALSDTADRVDAYALSVRGLLATEQLWDGRLQSWLTSGLSEKNLEIFEQLTRQAVEAHGRLVPDTEDQPSKD
jgi:predicted ArsR family transcriptional regulator